MNAARLRNERGQVRGRLLVLTTSLALGVVTALSLVTGPAAATTAAGLTYSCSYDVLGSNLVTPVVLDSDLPAVSGVKDPLNITTSMTLTMPASVAAKMEALPGFRTAQLSPDGANDGVNETYIAPTGRTPVTAHPVLSELAPDSDGDVPFGGMSPAPYAMNPGPSVPGTYSLVVGTLSFQLHVDATTPVTYQVSCQPPAVDVLIDTFKITAPTSTAVTVTGTWTYGDTPPGATATVTRTGSTSTWPAVSGSVQFYAEGVAAGAAVAVDASGTANLAHLPDTLAPGSHQISAAYLPDSASPYLASTSTPSPVTIDIGTSIAVTVSPTSVEIGDAASATATVTPTYGTTVQGQVTFTVDGATGDPVALSAGSATIALPTTAKGHHSVTANYAGSGLFESSTGGPEVLDVAVATTTTKLELDQSSAAYEEPVTASVTVSSAHQTPTGSVTVSVGDQVKTVPLEDGQAQLPLPLLPAGDYQIHADFTPTNSDAFSRSEDVTALTVSPDVTTTTLELGQSSVPYGQDVDATATVDGTYAVPGGSVTFTVNGEAVATAAVDDEHQAHATLTGVAAGTYQVVATFTPTVPGTSAVSVSNGAALTVVGDVTRTTLVLDNSRVFYGQRVTATATVTGSHATPTGSVTFTAGGRSVSAILVGGRARVRLPVLRPGSYQVLATFVPAVGSNVEPSTSAPARLTVVRDATMTRQAIGSSRHGTRLVCAVDVDAVHGTPVTGRVRVTLKQPGRGHKSKSVLLEAGSRTVRFSGLAKHGRWSVVATYAGSGTLVPSVSKVRRGGH